MQIPATILPANLLVAAMLAWLTALVLALQNVRQSRFRVGRLHSVYAGVLTLLFLLWSFEVKVAPGLGFHFLGVTLLTLMFGWPLGVIGTSLLAGGVVLGSGAGLDSLPLNALLMGALPVAASYGIYELVQRYLPHHVFIYMFLCAFLGAIIAAGTTVLAIASVLYLSGTYPPSRIAYDYLSFLPLYLFPEGVLNGMVTMIFIGLCPQWLRTFNVDSYWRGQ